MIKRSFNAEFMNSVINHPAVRDGAQAKSGADIATLVASRENVLLVANHGGFFIIKKMAGLYEWHTQFLPEGRGQAVRDAAKEALRYMFIKTDCMKVVTTAHTAPAIKLAREFLNEKGETNGVKYFSLSYDEWVETDGEVKAEGERFHDMVGDNTNHGEDDTHDIHVGSACLMLKSGNIEKAQFLYNQWAVMSMYEPAIIESINPLIVRIKDMILSIENGEILCQ